MKPKFSLALSLFLLSSFYFFCQESIPASKIFHLKFNKEMVSTPLSLGEGLGVRCLDNSYIKNNYFAVSPKKKSPWLGALLSGLLPGAGEFYGKNYLKAGIFLGAEVLAWGTF